LVDPTIVRTDDPSLLPQPVPVNVYEATEALVIVAAMAAVIPDDVEIEVVPRQVTLTARLRSDAPKDYLVHEWSYGPYERTVEIPAGFGADAEATLANGQLAVRLLRGKPDENGYVIKPVIPETH
jgi:HSP20 family molecular chaperone IbpA